jgi:hypothetical protein
MGASQLSQFSSSQPPQVYTARAFLNDFKPIESIIDGLPIGRGALVALTAPTGHGKTTIAAAIQVALTTSRRFAGREVTGGSVAVLAGENPDDYAMHLIATLQEQQTPVNQLRHVDTNTDLLVVPGTFNITDCFDHLQSLLSMGAGDLVAVFVDTSAAFFMGEEENGNVDMLRHARALRELTTLPGNPTVFVLCHPTKAAQRDNLLPRGGGAFLAEIDANLTLWKDDAGIITLHWCGKIRGPSFDRIRFELVPVQLEGKRDSRNRPIFSVAARFIPEDHAEPRQAAELGDGNRLLLAMMKKPDGNMPAWQHHCSFAHKSKVQRLLVELVHNGLAEKGRGGSYRLTSKGKTEAGRLPC